MTLKSIFEVEENKRTKKLYKGIYQLLKSKYGTNYGFDTEGIFESKNVSHGYTQNTYSGKLNKGIELSELELSMILDNGYSHFGGSSIIGENGLFKVIIYTD